ncbi:Hypothetical predicted protein [Podarcis lilfordi]|uniref:Uncharacterized protein n=1 Tax=Podarcis lilfordi TaxID=74358 RepID=A0AA35LEA8_9SAUR|nr:Hypothetical predicted protein [Podarcis lilfordi]
MAAFGLQRPDGGVARDERDSLPSPKMASLFGTACPLPTWPPRYRSPPAGRALVQDGALEHTLQSKPAFRRFDSPLSLPRRPCGHAA